MSIHRKLSTVCCATVLALGLAACGSSSDDATSLTDTTPTTMTPTTISPMEPTAAEQLANAQAAVADAKTMVEELAVTSSNSDRAKAYSSLAAAQAALAEASGIPENEIALLMAEIERLLGVINKAAMDAKVEADRMAAEMTAEEARIADLVAGTASAETKRKAIAAEAAQEAADDAGLGGSLVENETPYMMTISRPRAGTMIKIADMNLMGEDAPKFAQAMDLGHGRTMHVRTMEADDDGDVVTEVVIVATDIAAPKAVAFAKFEDDMGMTTQVLDARTEGGNVDEDNPADARDLSVGPLAEADEAQAAVLALVKSSAFTAGTAAVLMFDRDDDATANMDEAFTTAGTYNGAMGTYKCNGIAACTVTLDAMGAITAMTDGWIFTPAMGATSDQPDYDYLHYGFWLQKTADADGAITYDEVETFAGSSLVAARDVRAVTGSATYEGGATGVYVHSEVNSDGSRVATTAGQFSADASLTATFGQVPVSETDPRGTIAGNLLDTLSGTIDNFALENNEANAWAVNLQGRIPDDDTGTALGSANGGGAEGKFTATFHGPAGVDTKPSSVVGEFDANFSNGSVAGAFGARKQN